METWEWPDSLDALVAAPGYHTLLFENDDVRVLDTRVPSAEVVPLHTHRWPAVLYVFSSGDFVRRDGDGEVVLDSRAAELELEPGSTMWTEPVSPHTLENVGDDDIRMLAFEVKR